MRRGKDGKTCSRNEDKLLSVSSPKMPQLRRIVMNYATAFFACALTLAQRLWVAFEIFALAAADNTRFRVRWTYSKHADQQRSPGGVGVRSARLGTSSDFGSYRASRRPQQSAAWFACRFGG